MAFNQNKPIPNSPLNSAEIRDNFKHIKELINVEHTWDDGNPENVQHKLDKISTNVTGSKQVAARSGGSASFGKYGLLGLSLSLIKTTPGIAKEKYSLQDVLENLVSCSHTHSMETHTFNCNCNCNCNCDCGGNN